MLTNIVRLGKMTDMVPRKHLNGLLSHVRFAPLAHLFAVQPVLDLL